MNRSNLAKAITLKTTEVGTQFVSALALEAMVRKAAPNLFTGIQKTNKEENIEEGEKLTSEDKKKLVVKGLTIIGVTVAIALTSAAIANYASDVVEDAFWPEEEGRSLVINLD